MLACHAELRFWRSGMKSLLFSEPNHNRNTKVGQILVHQDFDCTEAAQQGYLQKSCRWQHTSCFGLLLDAICFLRD